MTDEKIIEVEVTTDDLNKMRVAGTSEKDLPAIGIKRYRPARHIIKKESADSNKKSDKLFSTFTKNALTI